MGQYAAGHRCGGGEPYGLAGGRAAGVPVKP